MQYKRWTGETLWHVKTDDVICLTKEVFTNMFETGAVNARIKGVDYDRRVGLVPPWVGRMLPDKVHAYIIAKRLKKRFEEGYLGRKSL